MAQSGLRFNKALGQNFLVDETVLGRIADSALLNKDTLVLEIGPGIGALTRELAPRAGRIIAVEVDAGLIPVLSDNVREFSNVDIINADILKTDIRALLEGWPGPAKVVANLPYYITTPILMRLLEGRLPVSEIVVMVQKEVAQRLCAGAGTKEYGAITVAVNYFAEAELLFDVPPHCFKPAPKVWSSVVRLRMYGKPPVELADETHFFRLVKAAFGQRRKTLVNSVYNFGGLATCKEDIKKVLNKFGVSENVRGETLDIIQYAQISNELFVHICTK